MSNLSSWSSLKLCHLHLDGVLLSAYSHVSVCGSQAKSRILYGEWCNLRFGLMVTSGPHKDLLSDRCDDVCFFGVLNYENIFCFHSVRTPGVLQHLVMLFL